MKETAQQYIHRILGNPDGKDPLKIQKSTAKKLHKIIKPLSKRELKRGYDSYQCCVSQIGPLSFTLIGPTINYAVPLAA